MWRLKMKICVLILIIVTYSVRINAQQGLITGQDTLRNPVISALPFLRIAPDARGGAMGETGIATSPDANSVHWNPAKLAFIEKGLGWSLSYSPWLPRIAADMSVSYLGGYKKFREDQVIAASFTYFDLGSIQFTDGTGRPINDFDPKEYTFDFTYSRKISENLSTAVTARFIHSNLAGNITAAASSVDIRPTNTGAADISLFYQNNRFQIRGLSSTLAFGLNISNIGPKITYVSVNSDNIDFMPTNLGIGSALTTEIDAFNKITFTMDFNKLLVPTPNGSVVVNNNGNPPLLSGIFGSFGDAPGGFSEELSEITISTGLEYWYNEILAVRAGYFHESTDKGNRKFFTMGLGLRYQKLGLDFSYLVANKQGNALDDTLRFTFYMNFDYKPKQEKLNKLDEE